MARLSFHTGEGTVTLTLTTQKELTQRVLPELNDILETVEILEP